jgi:pimeloyl-ACP methyl ester carboxylesterase
VPSPSTGLDRVIRALDIAEPELDAEFLADAVWLAAVMPQLSTPAPTPAVNQSEEPPSDDSDTGISTPRDGQQSHRLYDSSSGGVGTASRQVAVSSGRPLPATLDFSRALRPLRRPWRTGRRTVFDLDATVYRYAEAGVLLPSFAAEPERWFDAEVVVDTSPGMAIWEQTAGAITRLLDSVGAFRTVRSWTLAPSLDAATGFVLGNAAGRRSSPGELCAPDHRRLIFVVSDFAGDLWRANEAWKVLRTWSESTPTVLANPLPPRLWRRAGLGHPAVRAKARVPGSPGRALSFAVPQLSGQAGPWTAVPLIALAPEAVREWAATLMCEGSGSCDALLVPPTGRLSRSRRPARPGRERRSTAELVADFLTTAPPAAIRLAAFAAPLTSLSLPLLAHLREELVPEAGLSDIAELLISGLFEVDRNEAGPPALRIREEARYPLAERLGRREARRAFQVMSRRTVEYDGTRPLLPAYLNDPQGESGVSADANPFAGVSTVLGALLGLSPAAPGVRPMPEKATQHILATLPDVVEEPVTATSDAARAESAPMTSRAAKPKQGDLTASRTHVVSARDGRGLWVQEWGNPHGTPVFLLHGTPGSRLGPRPRDALLYRQGIRLITYDRPGYGDSDRLRGRRVAHAANDIANIADYLGINEFCVVGRSGGAPHALACAALQPHRVMRAAALVSLAPWDAEGLDWFAGMTEGNVAQYTAALRDHNELTRRLEAMMAGIGANPASAMPFSDPALPESDQVVLADFGIRNMLVQNYAEGLRTSVYGWVDDSLSFLAPWDFQLTDITVPTLLWHGENDIFSPVSHTLWLATQIQHAEFLIQPGAAHFDSVAVLPEVLRWLVDDAPQNERNRRSAAG